MFVHAILGARKRDTNMSSVAVGYHSGVLMGSALGGRLVVARDKVLVREVECKSLLNKVQSANMPFRWSINPYRGCVHACRYCYARRYHEYLGLGAGEDFERQILVKVNAAEVLRRELSRPSWRREWVALGTAVDPYQPVEGRYKLTRSILAVLLAHRTPCLLVTKNTMVRRDRDLLRQMAAECGCRVYFSVVTMDANLARRLEPDTPPPVQRLAAMEALAREGVDVGVFVAPVLPGLTDSARNLHEVARQAAAHGARYLSGAALRLQGSVREVFLNFLQVERPELIPLYEWLYPGAYARSGYRAGIARRLAQLAEGYGMSCGDRPAAKPMADRRKVMSRLPTTDAPKAVAQLSLF